MLQPKNRFKPIKDMNEEALRPLPALGSTALAPLRPHPNEIESLVKSDVPTSFWIECTPDIMRACLALNTDNYRPKIVEWIGQIGSDMSAKPTRFKLTGEPISFDIDGLMIDGQNRFEAGVAANFTFVFLFVVGLPKDASEVIGFGRPRKIAHVVSRMGYENSYMLSSAAGWLVKFKMGLSLPSGLPRNRSGAGTVEQTLDAIKRHPKLHASTVLCKQAGRQAVHGSALAAIHYVGAILLGKPELADAFVWELRNYPKKAKQTSAPFALCDELRQRMERGLDIPRDFRMKGAVEAWNLFMQGIEVEDNIKLPEKLSFKDLDYALL